MDAAGNAYVTVKTGSTDFPTFNPLQPTNKGGNAIVAKLNVAGSALVYSTYLGGSGGELPFGIAVDTAGNAYVTGVTGSSDFPMSSPLQATFGGGNQDAFVSKLNPAGTALAYSTYLGGPGDDIGIGIAVDAAGNAYVTGLNFAGSFPTASPLQPTSGGSYDAFVAKITTNVLFDNFAVFDVKVKLDLDIPVTKDAFSLTATFTLGPTSNGINLLTDAVTVQVGTYSTTIPAGSFKQKNGRFTFAGVINGAKLTAELKPLILGNDYKFTMFGVGTNLTGTVNPVTVGLTIGGDNGSNVVTATYYK